MSKTDKSALFFSGGVDAFSSLITHRDEKPILFTVYGADIDVSDEINRGAVQTQIEEVGNMFECGTSFVLTNFRKVLNETAIEKTIPQAKCDWWYYFHHSVAMMALVAPIAYLHGLSTIYFAATYHISVMEEVRLASMPCIDNKVRFCGSRIVHDGENYTRYQKIKRICDYSAKTNKKVNLRVCYQNTKTGGNCCKCEKCMRSLIPIALEGYDPRDFGFDVACDITSLSDEICSAIKYACSSKSKVETLDYYVPIWKKFREKYVIEKVPNNLKILYESTPERIYDFLASKEPYKEKYNEMKEWCVQLEQGKYWLESKWKEQTKELQGLKEWCDELQESKNWLESEYNRLTENKKGE